MFVDPTLDAVIKSGKQNPHRTPRPTKPASRCQSDEDMKRNHHRHYKRITVSVQRRQSMIDRPNYRYMASSVSLIRVVCCFTASVARSDVFKQA